MSVRSKVRLKYRLSSNVCLHAKLLSDASDHVCEIKCSAIKCIVTYLSVNKLIYVHFANTVVEKQI